MKPTLNEIKEEIDRFVDTHRAYFDQIDFVIGMSRGGLIPAVFVATKINKPLIATYINKKDEIFFDRPEWIKDKKVLIVDDIVRSGRTLYLLKSYLENNTEQSSIDIYTIYSVSSMRDEFYEKEIAVSSTEVKEDVKFPWDYDR